MMLEKQRCEWACGAGASRELLIKYHDKEWGVPIYDDKLLFEFLILEGAQSGLSWTTILKKRNNYRQAYDNFDPTKVAQYNDTKQLELLSNEGIIRNRLKVAASIINANCFLHVQSEYGSFSNYIWQFVDGKTIQNRWEKMNELPVTTKESEAMSKDLKKRGFKFVGSTICYSFMQTVGMVNDHLTECFRYEELKNCNIS